eukprot:Rmarinus@m.11006
MGVFLDKSKANAVHVEPYPRSPAIIDSTDSEKIKGHDARDSNANDNSNRSDRGSNPATTTTTSPPLVMAVGSMKKSSPMKIGMGMGMGGLTLRAPVPASQSVARLRQSQIVDEYMELDKPVLFRRDSILDQTFVHVRGMQKLFQSLTVKSMLYLALFAIVFVSVMLVLLYTQYDDTYKDLKNDSTDTYGEMEYNDMIQLLRRGIQIFMLDLSESLGQVALGFSSLGQDTVDFVVDPSTRENYHETHMDITVFKTLGIDAMYWANQTDSFYSLYHVHDALLCESYCGSLENSATYCDAQATSCVVDLDDDWTSEITEWLYSARVSAAVASSCVYGSMVMLADGTVLLITVSAVPLSDCSNPVGFVAAVKEIDDDAVVRYADLNLECTTVLQSNNENVDTPSDMQAIGVENAIVLDTLLTRNSSTQEDSVAHVMFEDIGTYGRACFDETAGEETISGRVSGYVAFVDPRDVATPYDLLTLPPDSRHVVYRIDGHRDIHELLLRSNDNFDTWHVETTTFVIVTVISYGIVSMLSICLIVYVMLCRRLTVMSNEVTAIRETGDMKKRVTVSSKDELTLLGHNINAMLQVVNSQRLQIDKQRAKAEKLLLNILPHAVTERLKVGTQSIAESHDHTSILFADIVGFTDYSTTVSAEQLVDLLNFLFSDFDDLCDDCGVEKIKTIGDCYMAVSGAPEPSETHAQNCINLGIAMFQAIQKANEAFDASLSVRIGIHSGAVVAGVIGKKKFCYDLWGDTVNTASRYESTGIAGLIQVSETTKTVAGKAFEYYYRGEIYMKGKGDNPAYVVVKRIRDGFTFTLPDPLPPPPAKGK